MDDVIDRLALAVKESGIPRKTIAYRAGMTTFKLSRLLRHKLKRPSIHDVEAVLEAIGRTMQSLYAGAPEVDVRQALRVLTEYVDGHEKPQRAVSPKRAPSRTARPFPVAATPNAVLLSEDKLPRRRIPDELWDRGARYAAKAIGDSMTGAGIEDGDIVFFRPHPSTRLPRGQIIVIRVNGSVYLKRFEVVGGEKRLESENPVYRPLIIQPGDDHELYGVVVLPRKR